MPVPPLRDAVVDRGEPRIRAHEIREQSEHDAGADGEEQGEREREPGRRIGVEPPIQSGAKRRVATSGRADLAADLELRAARSDRPPREAPCREPRRESGGEATRKRMRIGIVERSFPAALSERSGSGLGLPSNLPGETLLHDDDALSLLGDPLGRGRDRTRRLEARPGRSSQARAPAAGGARARACSGRARRSGLPQLLGRDRHPAAVFGVALLGGLALLTALSIGAGLSAHARARERVGRRLGRPARRHRGSRPTERPPAPHASLIGSIVAGGVVLPIVAGLVGAVCAVLRKWRIAAFAVFSLALESGAYRATTLVVHEHRPHVARLEKLPVEASYPSGHTAASIAVYGGLVLLLTSRIANRAFAHRRMDRRRRDSGLRGPFADVPGDALPPRRRGWGAARDRGACVIVFACRSAGAAARARRTADDTSRREAA